MWVGKNNLCAEGVLSGTIEYNGFRTGAVVHLWNTNLSANTNDKYKEKV